jgi:hypothetical protein
VFSRQETTKTKYQNGYNAEQSTTIQLPKVVPDFKFQMISKQVHPPHFANTIQAAS